MRTKLLLASFLFTTLTQAQERFAYTVTDINPATANWSVLRKINLQNGEFSNVLINGTDAKQIIYSAATKKQIGTAEEIQGGSSAHLPFSTGVAAIALDKRNNRLYYTPMFVDQLRYIDLKTMQVFYVTDQAFTGFGDLHNDEGKIVTRMVITNNGDGYAITNDATTLVHFSTGKKIKIENLGTLVDDPANTGISIHNKCSSWGGDMIADDRGDLYVFSAHNNVFKVNTQSKVATWLGPVKDLPAGYTINGVAVNDEGKLLTGSQAYGQSWYVVDPATWTATQYKSSKGVYLTSDLATSNVLPTAKTSSPETALIPITESPLTDKILMYPNPVNNNQFKIVFAKAGDFVVELTDVTGKQVLQKKTNVGSEGQAQTINLNRNTAKGIYLVKVTNLGSKEIFTQKLVVQ